jgi:hypothetical protein
MQIFDSIHCSAGRELLVSGRWGEGPYSVLADFFAGSTIGRVVWPKRSPDLTSPDFFLFEFLKEGVHTITRDAWGIFNIILNSCQH